MKYLIILFLTQSSYAMATNAIDTLLTEILEKSYSVQSIDNLEKSEVISLDSQLIQFKPTFFLSSGYSETDVVATSPFAAQKSKQFSHEIGASKLWQSGIQTSLVYNTLDNETYFSSRDDFLYTSPKLELSMSTSLFQNIFSQRFSHLISNQKAQIEYTKFSRKIDKKEVLIQSLIDYTKILEFDQSLKLQEEICNQTQVQVRNLEAKNQRRTISKREYYLGLKELSQCLASTETLEKSSVEAKENFKALYNTDISQYADININKIFNEAQNIYKSITKNESKVKIDDQDDVKNLVLQIHALERKQLELDALTQADLSIDMRTGVAGIGDDLEEANESLNKNDYPYVYLGMTLNLPIENRTASAQAIANKYQLKAIHFQKKQIESQKNHRYETLKKTLETDFSIYKRYLKTVSLSQSVVREGQRDFVNGRINFNDLTEFKKSLIQDQRTLSSFRLELIVRVVEYLDFYHYFDKFFYKES